MLSRRLTSALHYQYRRTARKQSPWVFSVRPRILPTLMKNAHRRSYPKRYLHKTTTAIVETKTTTTLTTSTTKPAATTTTTTAPVTALTYGDANCDGAVDMADTVLIMQALANPNKYGINGTDSRHLTDQGSINADVDTSTAGITGNDALKIQKFLLKIISSLV